MADKMKFPPFNLARLLKTVFDPQPGQGQFIISRKLLMA